jgi:hypothetical protein
MTLSELATLACTKMGRLDDSSIAEAKLYAKARYRMVWDSRLWRDSLSLITLSGSQLTNEFGDLLTDDDGNILTAGLIDQQIILPAIVDRVVTCRWGDSNVLQNETLGSMFYLSPEVFEQTGDPLTFSIVAPSAVSQSPGGLSLTMRSTSADATYTVTVRGTLSDVDQTERITLSGTSPTASTYSYDDILLLSKPSLDYDLIVKDSLDGSLLTLSADEASRVHQRIHFHSTPREAGSLLVLYKRRCRDLTKDSDGTEVTGIDNALLAYVIGDMLEGQRQYSKSQLKGSEGSMLLQQAVDMEVHQSASNIRIIPWDGDMVDRDCFLDKAL